VKGEWQKGVRNKNRPTVTHASDGSRGSSSKLCTKNTREGIDDKVGSSGETGREKSINRRNSIKGEKRDFSHGSRKKTTGKCHRAHTV